MKTLVLFIAFFSFFLPHTAFAQNKASIEAVMLSSTPASSLEAFEYQLPYPGLLPDSPLYFIKVFRDRLIDFLVSHPLKKAEFNLLQADKRMVAGQMLFAKGKKDLAETTISKGENYFASGISKLQEAKKQGMDTSNLVKRFVFSVGKHKQIIQTLIQQATSDVKKKLQNTEKRILEFEKQVNDLSPK